MTPKSDASAEAWTLIEKEKQRDRFVRRVSVIAWTVTFALTAVFTVLAGGQVVAMYRLQAGGPMSFMSMAGMVMPLIIVLGCLSLLIATLATVGVFLRLRTASLAEIQLRLAAIEEMVAGQAAR
jgi:hypothetical protein